MFSLSVKMKSGDTVTIHNLHAIRYRDESSMKESKENDFPNFLPYASSFYVFIGSDNMLTIHGKEIEYLFFFKPDEE